MKMKKILFPTDFSDHGSAALTLATSLARDSGARLLIVHVEEPAIPYGGGVYYGVEGVNIEDLEKMLQSVVPNDPQVPYDHRLVTGAPADAILRVADEEQVDMIVMGTHGRRGVSRLLMGSVAELVVRRATCPVLTFKARSEQPVAAS